ncbi:MAG: arylsulfotransferase family protein [Bacteroidota bacterium]
MMKNLQSFILIILFFSSSLAAQNTVGLLSYDPSSTFDGYNLLYPHNQPNVYLLNNCGEIVHTWTDEPNFRPGNTAYLMPNGNLIKTKRDATVVNDAIWAGGGGAIVEIRDWNNNLLWDFEMNTDTTRLHHDIAIRANGNIIMIAWELKTMEEAIQAGRNPAMLPDGELWPEMIIEVDPNTDEIVWEWHAWDHLIQDFDSTKDNFGVVGDHPELIDINYPEDDGPDDWHHANAIDYHETLSQVMISIPTFNELWIIDRTTTTQQAAGHFGGLSGFGGDLMYRWGNPAAYNAGDSTDQKMFYQHDPHWVDDFVDNTHPQFGKIAFYNNRVTDTTSTVNVFTPIWDMYKWSYSFENGKWGPEDYSWSYSTPDPTTMHSTGLSGIQFQPNGNALICVGRFGYVFEITPEEEIVWEYRTPLLAGNPVDQGTELSINNNLTFRFPRYPSDYDAFDGQTLDPIGYLETNPNTEFCDQLTPVMEVSHDYRLEIYPNPADQMITLEWDGGVWVDVAIYDIVGRKYDQMELTGGRKYLDLSSLPNGIYILQVNGEAIKKFVISR